MDEKRLVVLISGFGSNLQALIDATGDGRIHGKIVAVISNKSDAHGLVRARQARIPTLHKPFGPFQTLGREAYDADLSAAIEGFAPDLVILAGWMRILTGTFLKSFPGRVINLHPALPGQFPGTHAIERAFAAWEAGAINHTGVMVHEVAEEIDAGPVLALEEVPCLPGDSLEAFAARVHAVERHLLVNVVASLTRIRGDL